ncbi:endonuclease/exonuclease/phosphatase family protein [Pseudomonas capsici]|uniref:endonuclease/exonuclease/phosphatase family protein n=1 Tax=Pseudomonas capsici TaxID=2810614 RepID=UPI0021F24C11|nr:hypothetical protein [Pseudomonas capsici]MCV4282227.1 hypothetical protein [Pseudomonas capsici]
MALKIMVWNAQHFDNQSGSTHSQAFIEKRDFLKQYLAQQSDIDILVFLETGKTGNINQSLTSEVYNLPGNFVPVVHLTQEGGFTKNTTLGISTFVREDKKGQVGLPDFEYVLGDKERRAPVILKHQTGKYLAFYHANANENTSFGHIKDAIQFIHQEVGDDLIFFGGDLNDDYYSMNDSIGHLKKLGPVGVGYTHSKFTLVETKTLHLDVARRYEGLINRHGLARAFNSHYGNLTEEKRNILKAPTTTQKSKARVLKITTRLQELDTAFAYVDAHFDRQYSVHEGRETHESVVVTNRFLDYAFVHNTSDWQAVCHGSVAVHTSTVLGVTSTQRLCDNVLMRSDHFPVIYTCTAL